MNDPTSTTHPVPEDRRRRRSRILVAALALVTLAMLGIGAATFAWAEQRGPGRGGQGRNAAASTTDATCPTATVRVTTATQLQAALDRARPGAVIVMAPGRYTGKFVMRADGAPGSPITLCGTADSVLNGGATDGGYVVHLDGATNWVLQGFAVRNGQKGVMADATTGSVIRDLTISRIGDEAIHLRDASTDNQVLRNTISDTGRRKAKYGEGIYIGSAKSNWCDISDCKPDASDRNLVEGNRISKTTSESVDIKEGTTGGILRGNTFDGAGMVEADSWVDVKGAGWLIEGNTGSNSSADGFQTHEILDGWGTDNVFRTNTANLSGPGLGFSLKPERGNVVYCDNTVSGPGAELSNVECRD